MKPHSVIRFVAGIVRHPTEAWGRIRELKRIATAPASEREVPSDDLAVVRVIPVTADAALQGRLVSIYADNPSPYVHGPTSIDRLRANMARGIRYFLVTNSDGDYVGARAFDPDTLLLQNTVTEYKHRGRGYQLAAGYEVMKLLAQEGFTEIRAAVLKSNTRMQRTMVARGWKMEPDPDDPGLLRGVLYLDEISGAPKIQ